MKKLALAAASLAGLCLVVPSYASDRIQLAEAGVSVSIGAPAPVVVHRDRGYHRGYRHYGRGDSVVIVKKKRKPVKKTVIIER